MKIPFAYNTLVEKLRDAKNAFLRKVMEEQPIFLAQIINLCLETSQRYYHIQFAPASSAH